MTAPGIYIIYNPKTPKTIKEYVKSIAYENP